LAEPDVGQAYLHEGFENGDDAWMLCEQLARFGYGEFEHVGNGFAFVLYL
jgi:hypothetical protein